MPVMVVHQKDPKSKKPIFQSIKDSKLYGYVIVSNYVNENSLIKQINN